MRSTESRSEPLGWTIACGMLLGAGVLAWIFKDWIVTVTAAVALLLVALARGRRRRLNRRWEKHLASTRAARVSPPADF
jgi:uncharacterized membrane protein YfcA